MDAKADSTSRWARLRRLPGRALRGLRSRDALAVAVGGAAFVVSHPPIGWWPLVFVALVPLILVARRSGRLAAFGFGWLFGLVVEGGGTYWIGPTVSDFYRVYWTSGTQSAAVSHGLGLLAFLAWWPGAALLWGLWGLAISAAPRWSGSGVVWIVLALCCLEEAFPRIFPWNVGSAMVHFPTLAQPAHALGIPVLSLGVITVAVALAFAVDSWRTDGVRRAQRALLSVVVLFGAWAGYGEWRLSHAIRGKTVRVGYVQPNVPLTEKHAPSPPDAVYRLLLEETRTLLADEPCDIVIWPEGMFDLALIQPGSGVLDLGAPVLVGGGAWTSEGPQNGALAITASGGHYYAKRYLLAFGERFPFADVFSAIGIPLPGSLAPGTEVVTFEVGGVSAGVSICFEGILEKTGSDLLAAGAQLHLNITEDLWYGNSSAPYQHLALVALRALESGIPVARVANGGMSAAVDRYGRIRDRTSLGERRSGVFEIVAAPPGRRPWTRWFGDVLPWLGPLFGLAALVRRRLLS